MVIRTFVSETFHTQSLKRAQRPSFTCSRIASATSRFFLDAIRRVAASGSALDPEVVQRMVGRQRQDSPLDELTPLEREVDP